MLSKIKNVSRNKNKKRLLSNFISLSILQGANYILPIITFPYLVKVLGVEKFGLLAFATAIITYFNILTDYGFNLTATKEVSINREDKNKLNEIFSSVMMIKIGLLVFSIILLTIIIFSFDKFRSDYLVYYFSFGMVIGQVLFPQWFFQGIEEMKYITILNIFAKLIFTISIFIFIHKPNDYLYVPLINSLGYILAGIIALFLVFKKYGIKFYLVKLDKVLWQLKDGWHVFISRVFISGLTNTNTFLIGIFFDNKIVGYYSIAEKLIGIIKSFLGIISQTLFPYISKLIQKNRIEAFNFIKKIMIIVLSVLFILISIIYFISPSILSFLVKEDYYISLEIFRIFLIIPSVMFISTIIGQQILLPLNHMKIFSYSLITMSILHLILIYPVIKHFGIFGVVWLVVFTEISIMLYRAIGVYKLKQKGLL